MKRKLSALDSPTATGEDGSRRSNAVPRTEAAPATVIPAAMSEHQAQDSQSQPGGPESTTPPSDVPAKRESETLGEDSIASAPPEPTVTLPAAPVTAEDGQFGIFEVDDDFDGDSAYGDEVESITTSIAESVLDYKFENGRRYHAYQDGKYAMPNDDEEIVRLELQHRVWQACLFERLNFCPLPDPLRNVLDIGCGTGAWAIEFAEAHPDARVVGIDLSPIQPTAVPPNVEFIVDDVTAPWVYDQKFDYIHSRAITIGIRDWTKLVDDVWQNLAPGGWVEFQEYHAPFVSDDGTIARCPTFERWNNEILEAARKAGTKLDAILQVPEVLEKRGFVAVGTASTKWPLGPWPKDRREKRLGDLVLHDVAGGLEAISMRMFTRVLGWSRDEVTELLDQVAVDIRSRRMHAYLPIDLLWAQKPIDATDE